MVKDSFRFNIPYMYGLDYGYHYGYEMYWFYEINIKPITFCEILNEDFLYIINNYNVMISW